MIMAQLHWLYEEAIILNKGSEEKVTMGTGVYIVQARISRLVPNVLPIQGNMARWREHCKTAMGPQIINTELSYIVCNA